tara:strand:+ start:6050 stop:7216 length:1167 start_codon:yes stop_codon:yes gene_type:complete
MVIPKFGYIKSPEINLLKSFKIKKYLSGWKYYLGRYKYQNFTGNLINFFLGPILKNKFVFLRCDCDHFGPWTYLFLFTKSKLFKKDKIYFCLAKKNTINKHWIDLYRKKNLILIFNPLLQFIISPLFFAPALALDVNAHNYISFFRNNIKYKHFKRMHALSDDFLASLKNNESLTKRNELIFNKKIVLFYARTGSWRFSIKNSTRNMSEGASNELIRIISKRYNIFLVGDTHCSDKSQNKNIFDESYLLKNDILISEIYKRASFVIGSCSGGTHFPSLIFNIPTLYIADIPLWHLKAIYNLPASNYKNLSIPKKDKWLLISKEKFNSLTSRQYEDILKIFFNGENISSIEEFNTYRCDKSYYKEEPNFTKDKKGNIHVSEFSYNTLGI